MSRPQYVFDTLNSDSELSDAKDNTDDEDDILENVEVTLSDDEYENTLIEQQIKHLKREPKSKSNFYGKDETIWNAKPVVKESKSSKIKTHVPGVIGPAKDAKTLLQCWSCFFTEELLSIIVDATNKNIDVIRLSYHRERDCKYTDIVELRAFFGLLYMAGVLRSCKMNTSDLWSYDGTGVEIFRLTISQKRFHFILQSICFDDISTRYERKLFDKLAPVRNIFEIFVKNCQSNYSIGQNVCVDSTVVKFNGKCPFRHPLPTKPGKYGIKVYKMVDPTMLYTADLEIHISNQPTGQYFLETDPDSIFKRLIETIKGTGRIVTGNEFFTSLPLTLDLLENYNLTYVGPISKKKPEVPIYFTLGNRKPYSSVYGFQEKVTLVSYTPKEKKNLIVLSSLHHDPAIDDSTGDFKLPQIISFYNSSSGNYELLEKIFSKYSVARNTKRWPMIILYVMLNVAIMNTQVIYHGNKNKVKKNTNLMKQLVLELTKDQVERRSKMSTLRVEIRKRSAAHLDILNEEGGDDEATSSKQLFDVKEEVKEEEEVDGEPKPVTRKRCYICSRKKNRNTRFNCFKCKKFICLEHADFLCQPCSQI